MWDVLLGILIRQTFAPRRGGPQRPGVPAETILPFLGSLFAEAAQGNQKSADTDPYDYR